MGRGIANTSKLTALVSCTARLSLFFDCNKRTALTMMNGALISAGIYPLYTPATMLESFSTALVSACEYSDPLPVGIFFTKVCSELYPEDIDYGIRLKVDMTVKWDDDSDNNIPSSL